LSPTSSPSEVASALVGNAVLWVLADPRSGALLELGRRRPLVRPIPNPTIAAEQREFEGENSLFIQCSWELVLPKTSLAARDQSQDPDSLDLLDRVKGMSIARAALDESTWNLVLTFNGNTDLRLYPTRLTSRLVGGYTIRIDRFYWSVSERGEITEEQA